MKVSLQNKDAEIVKLKLDLEDYKGRGLTNESQTSVDQDMMDYFDSKENDGKKDGGADGGGGDSGEVKQLQADIENYKQQCDDYEQDLNTLKDENDKLKLQLNTRASPKTQNNLEEELKRQVQVLMVKESEIQSMKQQIQKYKTQIESNEMGQEVTEMSKKLAFADQDKKVKEMMITQLKSEVKTKE